MMRGIINVATALFVVTLGSVAQGETQTITITTDQDSVTKWKVSEYYALTGVTKTARPVWGNYGYATSSYTVPYVRADGYFTGDFYFHLPILRKASATLVITECYADDRAVVLLNGTIISDCSTNGPGTGQMQMTDPGSNQPYVFTQPGFQNNGGVQNVTVSSGLVPGKNHLQLIVNNTGNGISGSITRVISGNPESFAITATVSY